ncbi:MAG: L-threonylcarbamoyladenylate synthase [Armatimonadota bacterium]|nr:L-threonylcarbamoyladenylate synthase [Armatimonadota bacterium]MDR7533957.1 L-threonylcarbamoyladenylate synthase [Armatimonadota bacterium]MDR7536425.1 L-threonylcarbamoyladenylate synthase [Armatimonadota bacterium]
MPARLLRVDPADPDPGTIAEAAEVITGGGLVAFPTETVYGLGADALNTEAVERIFAAKGRPADNPLIVHVASPGEVEGLAVAVPDVARLLMARCWPGPLTLVLPAAPQVPLATRGGLATVAVRMPAHPVALALIRTAGCPVAAPSANRSGRPSPTTAQHVLADLADVVDLVLDGGPTPVGVESTVLDLTTSPPSVLRPGGVAVETLRELIGQVALPPPGAPVLARAPGTRYRHYAPRARVVLVEGPPDRPGQALAEAVRELWDRGLRVGVMVTAEHAAAVPAGAVVRIMGSRDDPATMAARLFAQLRELDEAGLDAIVVEAVEERGLGRAVMDRLRRAAGSTP